MANNMTEEKTVQPYEIGELDQYLFGNGTHYELYKIRVARWLYGKQYDRGKDSSAIRNWGVGPIFVWKWNTL
ncbi:Uncharacterised protein [Dorea longicatena]|nr:Uncharacterised protein [Dorea longicatena]